MAAAPYHHQTNGKNQATACTCCPYGYHIDLDFVQYAADEAARSGQGQQNDASSSSTSSSSLKFVKKQQPRKTSKSMTEDDDEVEGEENSKNRKSVYENVPVRRPPTTTTAAAESGKVIKTSTKLENQCLFSDSLENVMSDFEETLSRGHGGGGGGGKHKGGGGGDYSSDYEMPKKRNPSTTTTSTAVALDMLQHAAAMKSGAGRSDGGGGGGYASDCGYAVPGAHHVGRPTTLRYVTKPAPINHYYATPNTLKPMDGPSLNQSRLTPTSELLSPRLLTSSPVPQHQPPKPSLGLSGRVGAQIEQLAAHLGSPEYQSGRESARLFGEAHTEMSPTRRIMELENRLRTTPGPAFGGEKRRIQDELNRLINESRKTHHRSITPVVLDTGTGGGYATALAKAMSSVAAAERQRNLLPEPPPRRESVTRMQIGSPMDTLTVTTTAAAAVAPRVRTYSANGPAPAPSNGNGSLNLDAFHSYRRTNPLSNSSSSSTATTSTVVRPYSGRSASTSGREDGDYVSDSEYALGDRSMTDRFAALRRSRHLLSRPPSTLPPPPAAALEEKTRPTVVEVNGEAAAVVANSVVVQARPKPLTRSIGVATDVVKQVQKSNVSTCTAPLPEPKPCMECDGLRQRILELSVKPLTFTRGTETGRCTCEECQRQSRLTFATIGCGTTAQDTMEYRRDATTAADIRIPCHECETRKSIMKVSFGVNTTKQGSFGDGVETGANTDMVEVRNRHVNTEQPAFRTCSSNTETKETKNVESMVDKALLQTCGGYRTITSNTTPPLMVAFGVNTDPMASGHSAESTNIPDDLKLSRPIRSVEMKEEATETEEPHLGDQKIQEVVEKKSVAIGTDFVASSVRRMVDKYVDSTVRTRDVGTRTPPPPPPPLQPLRSSSCQTINEIKTMVSTGSGDSTLTWSGECDLCHRGVGSKSVDHLKSDAFEASTQTEPPRSDQQLPRESESIEKEQPAAVEPIRRHSTGEQEPKTTQRGIQRIFSPKLDTRPSEFDPAMWTSQTSANSDTSSDRALDQNEESTVVCPLDDEEVDVVVEEAEAEEESSPKQQQPRKFDYTKPRQTRAFALSKAAAAKKLLTSESGGQGQQQKQAANAGAGASTSGGGRQQQVQPQQQPGFQRTSVQSKSVRLDSKKGDSLAYITEKKQFQGQGPSKVVKPVTHVQTPPSAGLKGKVAIKKSPGIRKVTPAATAAACPRSLATPNRFTRSRPLPYQRRTSSSAGVEANASGSSSLTTSKDEEAAGEAEDVVGPLPSEVAAAAAHARWSASESACYTNLAVENGETDFGGGSRKKKLVGEVVENLPSKVERNGDKSEDEDGSSEDSDSSEHGDDETDDDESLDEGSYDTNGNISSTCDVAGGGDSTISEVSSVGGGDQVANAKFEMSAQLQEACQTLNSHLTSANGAPNGEQVEWAQKFLQHEWLKTAASKRANPAHVGDFLDALEEFSTQLLRHVVNYCDQNENTALHYAVSRGHFDIVSLLLDTKVCNLNKPNKAGYTPVMLASLCPITSDTDSMVIQRLFQMGDVNIKASQHGQTALMLAVSHGNLDTTKLLLEAGAGVNIQDEEGSTALMCAAEHGHKEIVRLLLAHPEIDASMTDNDNSTALSIAVENDHKDIGILIYAHLNYERPTPSFQSQSAPVWC